MKMKRWLEKIWGRLLTVVVLLGTISMSLMQTTPARAAVTCFVTRTNANGLGNNNVRGVFVSGSNVYAATLNGLSISTDGGASFVTRTTADGLGDNRVISVFVSGSNVYAATLSGLSISTDGGASFVNRTTADGLGGNAIWEVLVFGSNVYTAANSGGVSISTDGGANFVNRTTADGLGSNNVTDVFVSGSNVYATTNGGGVSISTDGGASFANRTFADGLGNNSGRGVYAVGSTVYVATGGGLSISTDGGASFVNRTTADGLGGNDVTGVFVSGSTVYAATSGGVSISMDGGASFTNLTTVNGLGENYIWSVLVSNGVIYASTSSSGLSISTCLITTPVTTSMKGNGITAITNGGTFDLAVTTLTTTFNIDVDVTGGAGGADSATNPANYKLLQAGGNGTYDFTTCDDASPGDDVFITVDSVLYDGGTFTSTLSVNSGVPLPNGKYRVMVCGSTSIVSLLTLPLNGGVDTIINFTLGVAPTSLPATGFPMGRVTDLAAQPAEKAYTAYGDLWLEIPSLDVQMEIVGVPQADGEWDTTWIGQDAGWLNGSAFPTWEGNTVLTGHVWDSWNQAGPFRNLRQLEIGDTFLIHAYGSVYTYEVTETQRVYPDQVASVFEHSDYDTVTLVTCESYSLWTGGYRYRRAVSAILVEISAE